MRRAIKILLTALLVVITITPFSASADDSTRLPRLTSISFKNAVIDQKFSSDNMTYTVTLIDNSASPTLESYKLEGDCELFIDYNYSETKQQTGITATIEYPTGSTIYTFTYSNPAVFTPNSNNHLAQLNCNYGELLPALNDNDTKYKLYIPQDLTRLSIRPVPQDTNAYCAQSPIDITLNEGQELVLTIDCIASNGSVRQYEISVSRAKKTVDEVKKEIEEHGTASLIRGTRFYEKEEFFIILFSAIVGIIILILLYLFTRRIIINPYDPEEVPFFDEA
ncbi:MAG: hypothetical protein J1E81_01710 [Eubacterium sp.]|nr:hypothetical protein [Eubacterium sp.]